MDIHNATRDYIRRDEFDAPAERVFDALASREGPAHWWTVDCTVNEGIGESSRFDFAGNAAYFVMKNVVRDAPRVLEWACVDQRHPDGMGLTHLNDWIGTHIRFEVEALGPKRSRLTFTHTGLLALECKTVCTNGWTFFLNTSLREYLEKGTGQPWRAKAVA